MRAAQFELAGGVHQNLEVVVGELCRQRRTDHVLDEIGLNGGLGIYTRLMLRGDEHGPEGDRLVALVIEGDLGLPVRAQVREYPGLTNLGQASGKAVSQPDRQRHEVFGLVAGVPEHHALIAGALAVELVFPGCTGTGLERGVYALGNVGTLRVNRGDDAAGVAIEAAGPIVETDAVDRFPDDFGKLDVGGGGDLARHYNQPGGDQRLAGHAGHRVLSENRIQDCV